MSRLGQFLAIVGLIQCASSLTVIGLVWGSSGVITNLPSDHASMVLYENCRPKLPPENVIRNVTLVPLNYSLIEFTYGHNPPEFPRRVENGTGLHALVFDAISLKRPNYLEDAIRKVSERGFDALVMTSLGDQTWISWNALRSWRTKDCAVPTYFITSKLKNYSALFSNADGENAVANLDFESNAVVEFIKTPAYILGVLVPSYIIAVIVGSISVLKLYRSGFPFIRNAASCLCCAGCLSSLIMSKFDMPSDDLNLNSTFQLW
jgi:hypothetical protein